MGLASGSECSAVAGIFLLDTYSRGDKTPACIDCRVRLSDYFPGVMVAWRHVRLFQDGACRPVPKFSETFGCSHSGISHLVNHLRHCALADWPVGYVRRASRGMDSASAARVFAPTCDSAIRDFSNILAHVAYLFLRLANFVFAGRGA